jgi:arylsulfatase A-like enzyme
MIRWPASLRPGRDDLLLSVPDIMPTLLGLMGLNEGTPPEVQGRDFSPILLGREMDRPGSALYLDVSFDNPAGGRRGLRTHRHTFVIEPGCGGANGSLALPETLQDAFTVDPESKNGNRLMLHDNREDPYQLKNVANRNREIVRELKNELAQWLRLTGDPWPYVDA